MKQVDGEALSEPGWVSTGMWENVGTGQNSNLFSWVRAVLTALAALESLGDFEKIQMPAPNP